MTEHTPTEQIKGLLGLLGIWLAWFFGNLDTIKEIANIIASTSATIASGVYAWYYFKKLRKEK
jgi:uncharacterized membrane protein YjjB (DUF3815 family)